MIKHARLKHTLATHKRARREWDRETKTWQIDDTWVCLYFKNWIIYKWNTLAKSQHATCFQKPNAFTTKCRASSLEESTMGPGNFTTKCLGFPRPFFNLISILQPSFESIFSTKCLACQSWSGPWTFSQGGLTTKWPIKTHFVVALRPPILYGKFAGGYHRPKANNKINQKQVCNP